MKADVDESLRAPTPIQRKLVVPVPNSPQQNLIVKGCMDPNLLEIWTACGTKFGKSLGASLGYTSRMSVRHGKTGRWIAPIYSQAKIGFKYCKRIAPPEVAINKSELSITFPGNDTIMEFKSGKYPEDLEGEGTDCNILDEAAKMVRQTYDSVKTTTTVTRGLIAGFSTPKGKNWFYERCMDAKSRMEWAKKKGVRPTHLFITAPSFANPEVTKAAIEEARRALPDRLYRQYIMAEFVDDGSVFTGFRDCIEDGPEIILDGKLQSWYHQDAATAPVVIGADWAKTQDRSVFWAFDLRTRRTVGFMRFYKTPYTEAIRRLVKFSGMFGDVIAVLHDKTGLGTVIDDYLAETELPYEGVTLNNMNKADMVTRLITGFEQQDCWLPNWEEMIKELDQYEVITTLTGNLTYGAPQGLHDDIVTAIFLSYAALIMYGDREYEVKFLEETTKPKEKKPDNVQEEPKQQKSALEQYYHYLSDDSDDD